ncbi:MAG TPA: four helix bundle protein [Candidatus Saccharimonadales bacterium]|nr:four helix bundle protein [Candidatus Saccharimonadales bacterium]
MATAKITTFTDLTTWQKAHSLVLMIYKATENFPKQEQFGLTSQLRRAAVSITSNIAEGFSRQTTADKAHFYDMALGSCTEAQNQLMLARDLKFLSVNAFKTMADLSVEVHKLLNGLIKAVRSSK